MSINETWTFVDDTWLFGTEDKGVGIYLEDGKYIANIAESGMLQWQPEGSRNYP